MREIRCQRVLEEILRAIWRGIILNSLGILFRGALKHFEGITV